MKPLCRSCGRSCRKYYKISKMAEMLDVSEKTLRRMIADRRIKAVRIGGSVRIPHSELHKMIQDY